MATLLALSEDRIARDVRHYAELEAAERSWRRAWRWRVFWLGVRCAVAYVAGGLIAWGSLSLNGEDARHIALCGGLLLSNAGPMAFGYAFWMRESGTWG